MHVVDLTGASVQGDHAILPPGRVAGIWRADLPGVISTARIEVAARRPLARALEFETTCTYVVEAPAVEPSQMCLPMAASVVLWVS